MGRLVPRGWGAPFWAKRVQDALPRDTTFTDDEELAAITPVLEELIAQTRLVEAMACRRSRFDGNDDRVEERIASHRRDLRAARRAKKET